MPLCPLCSWWSKSSLTTKDTKDTAGIGYVDDHARVHIDGYVHVLVIPDQEICVLLTIFCGRFTDMIGLDTNVLVRYLVQDEPRQSARARAFIVGAALRKESFFVNSIFLCELVWVLQSKYRYSKEVICDVLEKLLLAEQFEI
ncbi:MAG TPA: PIN domain-containing protein, partial [Acidobacteriota bacterium]